jgi:MarR family transcriptional regulator, transcriptional regulator for hemolysin
MEPLEEVIFYTLEKSIKSYRQFAQRQIDKVKVEITIDQWLILITLKNHPDLSQHQIAEMVFKDYASVTRIIEILVRKDFITRVFHPTDRRRFELRLTKEGEEIIIKLSPIVIQYRKQALKEFSIEEIQLLKNLLNKIISNSK